ncbi:hypothetical protein V8C86DRAFT_2468849 [Haematococcus lacustris]
MWRALARAPQVRTMASVRPRRTVHCSARLIALDFDGVVCDSVGESAQSAFRAACLKWPEIFATEQALSRRPELLDKMRTVRPVVETGYENVIMIRCLYEGTSCEDMLANWDQMLPQRMKEWKCDRSELVQLFGKVRDDWIAEDVNDWLAPNSIYEGVPESLKAAMAADQLYIVTTKQATYTEILLRDMAGVALAPEHIFSQTISGRPKGEVLAMLASRHPDALDKIFVEDKLSTLEKVCQDSELHGWKLLLADWGYNTPEERARAAGNTRIQVITRQQFHDLLAEGSEN